LPPSIARTLTIGYAAGPAQVILQHNDEQDALFVPIQLRTSLQLAALGRMAGLGARKHAHSPECVSANSNVLDRPDGLLLG
jgi:hypothetical protein